MLTPPTKTAGLLLAWLLLMATAGCGRGEQPPFAQEEFVQFMADATLINTYMLGQSQLYHVTGEPDPQARMREAAHRKIEEAGWDLDRFYYIYKRCVVFGTYLRAKGQAEERELFLMQAAKFGKVNRREAQATVDAAYRDLTSLREKLDADIPVSERVFLYERGEDIMRLLKHSAIHFLP